MGGSVSLPLRIRVLRLLTLYPDGLHAYAIAKELDVSSGSLYPALARLVGAGHIRTADGPVVERAGVKKHQVIYHVTEEGTGVLREARAALDVPTRVPRSASRVRVVVPRDGDPAPA